MKTIKLIMTGKLIEIGDLECLEGEPDDKRSGVVLQIDREQLNSCRNLFGETVGVFGSSDYPGWRVTEPPKDGTCVIAKGRIITEDELGCTVTPYLGEIFWKPDDRNSANGLWMYQSQGWPLSVTCSPDETFKIDYWIHPPA